VNASVRPIEQSDQRWYWLCQLGGWGLLFVAQLVAARLGNWPWERAIIELAGATAVLMGATHLIRRAAHRHDWFALGLKALARRSLFLSLGIAIALILMLAPVEIVVYGDRRLISGLTALFLALNLSIVLLVWHMLYFGSVLIRQRHDAGAEEARLRAALRTAELSLLKSQLNPHFLFNALNTVRALINESPQRAEKAVTQLARTLRYSLNASRDELVTLDHELGIVDDYLGIETLRLAERLTIERDVHDHALPSEIPIMLLQTLVENAVKHGISQLPEGGTLRIAARMEEKTLVIEVSNDRPLVKMGSIPSDRVGLANANERLRLMIGHHASLKLDLSHPQRAVATVRIPQLDADSNS
jgi:two-component system sensor histidine kinase AlgZ